MLGMAAVLARIAAHLETEAMWFHELGQDRVFWTLFVGRWLAGSLTGLGTTAVLLVNFWFAERTAPAEGRLPGGRRASKRLRRILLSAQLVISAGAGLAVSRAVVLADWQHMLLWLHRRDFGVTDPLFHKDVGFFVFSLPLYENVARWLIMTTAIALACAFATHAATGAIRTKPAPISATRAAHAHVLGLGALLLALVAWQHRLSQFALELPRPGETVPGAGYTAVHIELAWLQVLVVVTLAAAAMLAFAAVRRSWSVPAVAVAMIAVAELVNPAVLPSVVQRFVVEPQTLSRERPYLAHTLALTRRAYGLDRVADLPVPANAAISNGELRANRDVIQNIQLWDTAVLRPEIAQQQAIGSYYGFPKITVDRYQRGGKAEGMIVAERELDLSRLDPSGRTWANDKLAYTHGFGLVAVPAGDAGVDDQGKPRFVTSEFGAGRPPAELREPRVYFGVQPRRAQPWVIVRSRRKEVEKPLPGDSRQPEYHYSGGAGISMSSPLRRALFALRFGDLNLLLSETLGAHPRILLHRDVGERLRSLAPFLHFERRPEVIVVGGRIMFLAHGYTTSDSYPYAARIRALGGTRAQLPASVGRRHRGRLQRRRDDVPDRHRRSDHGRLAGGLPHPVHSRRANAWGRPCASALPAGAVRRPGEDLGELPHQGRRRLLYQGRRVEAASRGVGADPEARQPAQRPHGQPASPEAAPGLRPGPPARSARRAVHAHDHVHAVQRGEPQRLPDRHDRCARAPVAHAAEPAALAPGAGPVPGHPADPRQPGSERQAAAAQPGDDRPGRPLGQHRRDQRSAGRTDRRLVPLRPDDLRQRSRIGRRPPAPRDRVPQRAGGIRQEPGRRAAQRGSRSLTTAGRVVPARGGAVGPRP